MAEERWLLFREAVGFVRSRLGISPGAARAKVDAALASGEVQCRYTDQAWAIKEAHAYAELRQSIETDAAARGLKMSGSVLDILRSRAQREATERAARRLLMRFQDFSTEEFAMCYVCISCNDLLDWLDRNEPQAKPPPTEGSALLGGRGRIDC